MDSNEIFYLQKGNLTNYKNIIKVIKIDRNNAIDIANLSIRLREFQSNIRITQCQLIELLKEYIREKENE